MRLKVTHMTLKKEIMNQTIKQMAQHDKDTGSTQVQLAILTERINQITAHLKKFQHDFSAKQGLLKLVARRRKFLRYLESTDSAAYVATLQKLELKK